MGRITIDIASEIVPDPGDGLIGGTIDISSNCLSRWNVTTNTTGSMWYEWTFSGITTNISVSPSLTGTIQSGVNSPFNWVVEMDKFRSPDYDINASTSSATLTLYDFEGGTQINSKTFLRKHSNFDCISQ
tara:strand:+ start:543 stop:932 length:390 start_codon:yes stop_codon:yes gene_type:complete